MTDLRDYKAVVLDALKDLRKKDAERMPDGKGWGWSLKRIGKKKLILKWGYIPDVDISICVREDHEDPDDVMLVGRMDDRYPNDLYNDPDAEYMYVWIGNHHWNDASSIDRGLKLLMSNIGYITRTRY